MSNSLDPDQARHFVGPDLGPNCLQRLTVDGTSGQRVNSLHPSCDFFHLLMTFPNSLDSDQARHNVGKFCLGLIWVQNV